jgi:hypothetical protein
MTTFRSKTHETKNKNKLESSMQEVSQEKCSDEVVSYTDKMSQAAADAMTIRIVAAINDIAETLKPDSSSHQESVAFIEGVVVGCLQAAFLVAKDAGMPRELIETNVEEGLGLTGF